MTVPGGGVSGGVVFLVVVPGLVGYWAFMYKGLTSESMSLLCLQCLI